ncbi:MAG: hypothetical protein PUE84_10310 [Firmicutes bacterium]|nr:hypothetical protein [Bacillota bacterium]
MKKKLFELCRLAAIGGFEQPVRQYLMEQARPFADEMKTDKMGNLLIYRQGTVHLEKPLMLMAHMDEPGFLVTNITDDGMVQLAGGGMNARALIGKHMEIHDRRSIVYGAAGMKAEHMQTPEEQKKTPDISRLLIDIGCTSKTEAEARVRLGDVAVPLVEPELLGMPESANVTELPESRMMTGRGLASRGGCAVLLKLLEEKPACDCWFVFAVSGENWSLVPGKGGMLAARLLDPAKAVLLHGVDTGEGPGVPAEEISCRCGAGAAISLADADFVFDRALREKVTAAADQKGVRWQFNCDSSQVTGAGRLASAHTGCRVLPVNLPVRYLQSAAGVCCLDDLESMTEICRLMMERAGECNE